MSPSMASQCTWAIKLIQRDPLWDFYRHPRDGLLQNSGDRILEILWGASPSKMGASRTWSQRQTQTSGSPKSSCSFGVSIHGLLSHEQINPSSNLPPFYFSWSQYVLAHFALTEVLAKVMFSNFIFSQKMKSTGEQNINRLHQNGDKQLYHISKCT